MGVFIDPLWNYMPKSDNKDPNTVMKTFMEVFQIDECDQQ